MYTLFKKLLFQLDPEVSHTCAMRALQLAYQCGLSRCISSVKQPQTVMGLTFANRIGLAAGLDKNADYVDALAALGFGFIEIGTVTPRPQIGNPKPRLFRLAREEAIINRMGFNNKGVDYVKERLQKTHYRGVLGVNIGKNKETPNERAIDDYLIGFRELWPYASYITINISSPNTPGLRDLQQNHFLSDLLGAMKKEQELIAKNHQKYVPLAVKIAPDLSAEALDELSQIILQQKIDAVIATNTTISRKGVEQSPHAQEAGGLSGAPLDARNTEVIRQLYAVLQNKIPIIAVGGVMNEKSAHDKLQAGASLLQIYTGFIYHGPGLIKRLASIK